MNYLELKQLHQKRINSLPIKFAFSDEQFVEAMAELGLKLDETDQVRLVFRNGFCHKDSVRLIIDTFNETGAEMEKAMQDDEFCIDAIKYELANHEYCYSHEPDEALEALGLSLEDKRTVRLFKIAKERYIKKAIDNGWMD